MKILAPLLCLLAGAAYAEPQTGSATAKDTCSVASTGNNNTFTITCGIGKQQGDALLKIMNKILANQLDPDAVIGKLDELLRRTGDRTLTSAQVSLLTQALRQSPQSIDVTLLGDREANAFGKAILEVLRTAGWTVRLTYAGMMSPPPYGVIVAGIPPSRTPYDRRGYRSQNPLGRLPC
jgi:hypothetical protein